MRPSTSSQPRRVNSESALFTRSRLAPTRPARSSWVIGSRNSSALARQLEQALRRPAGHVEEHRVGERLVGRAQPAGQEAHDDPEELGLRLERGPHRVVVEHEDLRRFERAGVGRSGSVVEEPELAEQRSLVEHRDERLATVG